MDTVTRVQIRDEADCISHNIDAVGKSINPITFPPAVDKIVGQTELFNLGVAIRQSELEL